MTPDKCETIQNQYAFCPLKLRGCDNDTLHDNGAVICPKRFLKM